MTVLDVYDYGICVIVINVYVIVCDSMVDICDCRLWYGFVVQHMYPMQHVHTVWAKAICTFSFCSQLKKEFLARL